MNQPDSDRENQKTDEQIARLVQSGNIEIFGELVGRYEVKLQRYGQKFLSGDKGAMQDAVQETFLKVYQNICDFDASRKFSSWIYRIAHNEFINILKKRHQETFSFFSTDVLFPHPVAKEKADQPAEDNLTRQLINQCFEQLPPKYREPLVLYFIEQLSYEEISDVLRIPVSTVGVRLKRGKETARRICDNLRLNNSDNGK